MIESLKKGDSLSKETWQKFLNLASNKTHVNNQNFDAKDLEKLRKNIEVVYMPQNEEILKKRVVSIEKDPASSWLTYKVYVYKNMKRNLRVFRNE